MKHKFELTIDEKLAIIDLSRDTGKSEEASLRDYLMYKLECWRVESLRDIERELDALFIT